MDRIVHPWESADDNKRLKEVGFGRLFFIVSLNLHRRHLNESQRAMVAGKLANIKKGGDRKSENQKVNLANDISQADAAKLLNVSTASVKTAKKVQEKAVPELTEK